MRNVLVLAALTVAVVSWATRPPPVDLARIDQFSRRVEELERSLALSQYIAEQSARRGAVAIVEFRPAHLALSMGAARARAASLGAASEVWETPVGQWLIAFTE